MEKKQITVFISDCGKKYFSQSGCKSHEKGCKCWTNPKHKTCLTCDHYEGSSYEYFDCAKMSSHTPPTPPHVNAPNINANCPLWEQTA